METRIKTRNSKKWWALAAITLAVLVVGIDQTVLSLALPTLAKELHATNSELQWFVAAFSLALCATLLSRGSLETGSAEKGCSSSHWPYSELAPLRAPFLPLQPC